jgi:hypothetical protein
MEDMAVMEEDMAEMADQVVAEAVEQHPQLLQLLPQFLAQHGLTLINKLA